MRGRETERQEGNGEGENVRVRGSPKGIEAGRGGWERAGCLQVRARERGRKGGGGEEADEEQSVQEEGSRRRLTEAKRVYSKKGQSIFMYMYIYTYTNK